MVSLVYSLVKGFLKDSIRVLETAENVLDRQEDSATPLYLSSKLNFQSCICTTTAIFMPEILYSLRTLSLVFIRASFIPRSVLLYFFRKRSESFHLGFSNFSSTLSPSFLQLKRNKIVWRGRVNGHGAGTMWGWQW